MSALLYRSNDEIRLRELRCASLFGACRLPDRALLDHLDSVDSMAQASPDGALIAVRYSADWRLYRADCLLSGATCPGAMLGLPAETMRLAWGPDGSAFGYLLDVGRVLRIRSRGCLPGESGDCRDIDLKTGLDGFQTPAWSADGTRLAVVGVAGGVRLLDAACLSAPTTCRPALYPPGQQRGYTSWASLSRDGSQMLYQEDSAAGERIAIVDLASGERRYLSERESGQAATPAWDTSERFVAFILTDLLRADMLVVDLDRGISLRLSNPPGAYSFFPAWLKIPSPPAPLPQGEG